jgi:hypothetical protein
MSTRPSRGDRYALSALRRQRATLAAEIVQLESKLRHRKQMLAHVDATLRLLDPSIEIESIRNKRLPKHIKLFRQGELGRLILGALRDGGGPMTTAAIVKVVLAAGGHDDGAQSSGTARAGQSRLPRKAAKAIQDRHRPHRALGAGVTSSRIALLRVLRYWARFLISRQKPSNHCVGGWGVGIIEGVPIAELVKRIQALRNNLEDLQETSAGSAVADPVRDKIADLTRGIIDLQSVSGPDLARKAALLLYWLDPVAADIPHLLSASLCRDVVLMFSGEP